jgi:phosphohistidine phosphatase
MNLVLWRHADAEDGAPGMSDDARRLTAKGEKQAKRVAAWLRSQLPEDAEVLVSPARRAQQTAQALTKQFKTSGDIGTGAGPESVLKAAGWPEAGGTVVVVGHQPTLGQAAALALEGKPADWSLKKGAIWWLESRDRGDVVVRAALAPDQLK